MNYELRITNYEKDFSNLLKSISVDYYRKETI